MAEEPKDRQVECRTHGTAWTTFVCRHLAGGGAAGLGVCYDDESGEPWPDLVCDVCAAEPEWTREQSLERIRLLCSFCWEDAFGMNTTVRHADEDGWLRDALQRAQRRQDQWAEGFGILKAARYRYGLEESPPWLGFGPAEGRYDVLCDATVIGSWSSQSRTWLWGWANSWWEPSLTREMVQIKRAGERLGIEPLWRSSLPGDESIAWSVSGAVLDLLPSFQGLYRAPSATGSLFLAVRNTRRVT